MSRPSIKSYLVQAIWNWCTDVGLTPYVLVRVDDNCVVPQEFVEDGQIIFDISSEATHNLTFDDREIYRNIAGMFPQEEPNKGMMFSPNSDEPEDEEIKPPPPKPVFSRVK